MNHFKNTFIKGLITILPLVVTVYFIYWFVVETEGLVRTTISTVLPTKYYVPGLGLIAVVCLVYIVGLVASAWIGRKLVSIGESVLEKVPLVKTIYRSMKDLLNYFDVSDESKLNKPAIFFNEQLGAHMIGFVTQDNQGQLPGVLRSETEDELVAVYLPMSYQVGGFMIFVKKELISVLDMSIEEAMQYTITAGVSGIKAKQDDQ